MRRERRRGDEEDLQGEGRTLEDVDRGFRTIDLAESLGTIQAAVEEASRITLRDPPDQLPDCIVEHFRGRQPGIQDSGLLAIAKEWVTIHRLVGPDTRIRVTSGYLLMGTTEEGEPCIVLREEVLHDSSGYRRNVFARYDPETVERIMERGGD